MDIYDQIRVDMTTFYLHISDQIKGTKLLYAILDFLH